MCRSSLHIVLCQHLSHPIGESVTHFKPPVPQSGLTYLPMIEMSGSQRLCRVARTWASLKGVGNLHRLFPKTSAELLLVFRRPICQKSALKCGCRGIGREGFKVRPMEVFLDVSVNNFIHSHEVVWCDADSWLSGIQYDDMDYASGM